MVNLLKKYTETKNNAFMSLMILASVCIVLGCQNTIGDNPTERAFGVIEVLLGLLFITIYFYKIVSKVLPIQDQRKKKIHIIIAYLISFICAPITIIWYFLITKSLVLKIKDQERLSLKGIINHNYAAMLMFGYVMMVIGAAFLLNFNIKYAAPNL